MTDFWKKLMGRRTDAAHHRAEEAAVETPEERRMTEQSVDDVAADEVVKEQLGGVDPNQLVDDEFKP